MTTSDILAVLRCAGPRGRIISYILTNCSNEGYFLKSRRDICRDIHCTRRYAMEVMRDLAAAGLLVKVKPSVHRIQWGPLPPKTVETPRNTN